MFATSFKVSVLQLLFFFIVLKLHRTHLCWQFVMTRMFTIPIIMFTKKRGKKKRQTCWMANIERKLGSIVLGGWTPFNVT